MIGNDFRRGVRLIIAAILTVLAGCAQGQGRAAAQGAEMAPALERFEYRQLVMGVEARIVLYAGSEAVAQRAARAAFARLDEIDAICSDYRPDSELMRLCAAAGGPPVAVSTDFWAVLSLAQEVSAASGGAFDVNCGALSELWRGARRTGVLPTDAEIDHARGVVRGNAGQNGSARGDAVLLDEAARTVALTAPGMRLDLGGIAKGYALGAAMAVLQEQGTPSAMIEMGGDLALGAPPTGEAGWRIQIGGGDAGGDAAHGAAVNAAHDAGDVAAHSASGDAMPDAPRAAMSGPAETLLLSHAAVATSGDASQFVEFGGVRYGHIVDPRTGWALSNRLQSHVVIPQDAPATRARTAALADALATAACVLGEAEGRALAERFGASEVRFLRGQPRSLFDGRTLDGWTTRGGRYDGDALWAVEDGCLVGRTGPGDAGGLLYTVTEHSSFELSLECRLDRPFDSGIFVRMAPDARGAQLTLDDRPGGEVGGLYSDGWLQRAGPEAAAAWRADEWNRVVVRCTGFDLRMQAWINGVAVLDATVPQEFGADGKAVFAPRGLIGLQVHGGGSESPDARARFRNLTLRDLPVLGEDSLAAGAPGWEELIAAEAGASGAEVGAETGAERGAGEVSAPNSRSATDSAGAPALAAWEAIDGEGLPRAPDDYRVVDGVLHIPSSEPGGYLRTRADFRDFAARFDFRQARMSNSGLFLRGRREAAGPDGALRPGGNPAHSGCELQLLDDFHWEAVTGSTLAPYQFTASLYGAVPARAAGDAAGGGGSGGSPALRAIGEWNTLELLYRGSRLAVALNGLILYDVDTHALKVDPPFSQRAPSGFLGLQRYAAPDVPGDTALWLRGMRVKRL